MLVLLSPDRRLLGDIALTYPFSLPQRLSSIAEYW
jgi:hypothetical protein